MLGSAASSSGTSYSAYGDIDGGRGESAKARLISGDPPKGDCALPLRGVDMPVDDGREGGFAPGGISPTRSTTKGTGDGEGDSRSWRIDGSVGLGESRWRKRLLTYTSQH